MAPTLDEAVRNYYAETDAEGLPAFRRWLTPECRFRFNNGEPLAGREAVAEFILGRRRGIRKLQHKIEHVVVDDRSATTAVEITVQYVTDRGAELDVRGSAFVTFVAGQVDSLRVYVDPRPLLTALAAETS